MFDLAHYRNLQEKYIKINKSDKKNTRKSLKVLNEIRQYLDLCGMELSHPKYKFDLKDMDTWKYLESKIYFDRNGDIFTQEILNPRFKYSNI